KHFDAFVDAEKRFLLGVLQNGDDQQIKHFLAALDQVEVAVCHGIERARINSDRSFHLFRGDFWILTQSPAEACRKLERTRCAKQSEMDGPRKLFATRSDCAIIHRLAAT